MSVPAWGADLESALRKGVLAHTVAACVARGVRRLENTCGRITADKDTNTSDSLHLIARIGQRFRRGAEPTWLRTRYDPQTAGIDIFTLLEESEYVLASVEAVVHDELNSHELCWLDTQSWGSPALRSHARREVASRLWNWADRAFEITTDKIMTVPARYNADNACMLCASFDALFHLIPTVAKSCLQGCRFEDAIDIPAWRKLQQMFLPMCRYGLA